MSLLQAFITNVGTSSSDVNEKYKWRSRQGERTDAGHGCRLLRSSDEASIMEVERRG